MKLLHYVYSLLFWVALIIAVVLAGTGVESKFIYTDF